MKRNHHHYHEGRSSSSCAACKLLKRRCVPNCQFAPYFPSGDPKKFAKVHKVFGASNVGKILNEVPEEQRQETVNSLVYEAEVRLRDPVYGCIGAIASLQQRMAQLQTDLLLARARLAACSAAAAAPPPPPLPHNPPAAAACSSSSLSFFNHHLHANASCFPGSSFGGDDTPAAASGGFYDHHQQTSVFIVDHSGSLNNNNQFGQYPFPCHHLQ